MILIVEDEKAIVDILAFNLKRAGYEPLTAMDGETGLAVAREKNPDLILLDVMLPGMDGFAICKTLRAEDNATPIIMLTAREEEDDKVLGLELGADDYITKPFSVKELLARVAANIRRHAPQQAPPLAGTEEEEVEGVLKRGPITLHMGRMEARKNGAVVELSQREYDLLAFLAANPDQVYSREQLMEKVWNYEFYGDLRTVDVTVRRLREKIEDNPAEPTLIITRRGVGYLFSAID